MKKIDILEATIFEKTAYFKDTTILVELFLITNVAVSLGWLRGK
ncbi:hypothetical protein [Lysinibacillus xylanilyticus]